MGWSIGVGEGGRDIGYGVPAQCDKPGCDEEINRGFDYCCGDYIMTGYGCGLYFCGKHLTGREPRGLGRIVGLCPRCYEYRSPYEPKPDIEEWQHWKLVDASWAQWRAENPDKVAQMTAVVADAGEHAHDWPEEDEVDS